MISNVNNSLIFDFIYDESVTKSPVKNNFLKYMALGTKKFIQSFVENIPYNNCATVTQQFILQKYSYQEEYETVLKNGFTFQGGYVVEAYYYPKAKQIWFILNDINYDIRHSFTKKALDTWESFGGEIIPITTSMARFNRDSMPSGAIQLKVGL